MSVIATWRARAATVMLLLSGLALITMAFGPGGANAKGGTAKPPSPPPAIPTAVYPHLTGGAFNGVGAADHGFDVTGFIQATTVSAAGCPVGATPGGTVTINGIKITVPCNSIVQMPANTLDWQEAVTTPAVNAATDSAPVDLTLDKIPAPGTTYPSFEARVVGNIVNDQHVAGLVFISQQGVNSGTGVVTAINYGDGTLTVNSKSPTLGASANPPVLVRLNDPSGRFGLAHSPDHRFSVDDENPTVHSGTGYPMCIPRQPGGADPLCPETNRPAGGTAACRNFAASGVTLPSGVDIVAGANPDSNKCMRFMMKAFDDATRLATDPDARQQAPIEVGDSINYAGTLMKDPGGGPDYISAHTIEVNIGIYTQPGTQPAYVAIGEFGVGSADPALVAVNGANQETQDRIFLEAETTDPLTAVDIYMNDVCPTANAPLLPVLAGITNCSQVGLTTAGAPLPGGTPAGGVVNRWITPFDMTGENNGPLVNANANLGGGIDTQANGAQVQRARLRATKAPLGWLSSPTRTVRVVQRSLCLPPSAYTGAGGLNVPVTGGGLNGTNRLVAPIDKQVNQTDATGAPAAPATAVSCTQHEKVANGLFAGQYEAPTFEFIFPENVSAGDPIVPNDFWHLGFLVNGEGGSPSNGGLSPAPW